METYISHNGVKNIKISKEKLKLYPDMYLSQLSKYRNIGQLIDMKNDDILINDCSDYMLRIIAELINNNFDPYMVYECYENQLIYHEFMMFAYKYNFIEFVPKQYEEILKNDAIEVYMRKCFCDIEEKYKVKSFIKIYRDDISYAILIILYDVNNNYTISYNRTDKKPTSFGQYNGINNCKMTCKYNGESYKGEILENDRIHYNINIREAQLKYISHHEETISDQFGIDIRNITKETIEIISLNSHILTKHLSIGNIINEHKKEICEKNYTIEYIEHLITRDMNLSLLDNPCNNWNFEPEIIYKRTDTGYTIKFIFSLGKENRNLSVTYIYKDDIDINDLDNIEASDILNNEKFKSINTNNSIFKNKKDENNIICMAFVDMYGKKTNKYIFRCIDKKYKFYNKNINDIESEIYKKFKISARWPNTAVERIINRRKILMSHVLS
jgi:hypothetical protein